MEPFISSNLLLQALTDAGVLNEAGVLQLLGIDRHGLPLPELELRLVDTQTLSDRRLLAFKGQVAGLPVAETPSFATPPPLPEPAARAAGALVLTSGDVAFVEPTDRNVETVTAALGRIPSVVLVTVTQFKQGFREVYLHERVERHRDAESLVSLFDLCIKRRATDMHLQASTSPKLRIDGALVDTPLAPLTKEWIEREFQAMFPQGGLELWRKDKNWDYAYQHGAARFRVNLGFDAKGPTMAARLLSASIPSMDELGLPPAVRAFTELDRGLVLVTGPTGSGKSTSLAALLDHITRTQRRHVITLEDPVEYILSPGDNSMVNQREFGADFTSFPAALRQALRQDPDVLLVGELRDPETAITAVTAAETGHLVFGTLHTFDAQSTVARLVSMYPEGEQDHAREKLAYILKGVVSQTLLPRAGRPGRVAALEIMVATPPIANNLRNAAGMGSLRSTMQTSRKDGMQTMEMALAALVMRGLVSQDEAESRARMRDEFHRYLNKIDLA